MKHIFITGANRGIGLALVKQYLKQKYKVSVTYRTREASQALLELERLDTNLTCYQLDVTDYVGLSNLPNGLEPIDILINNAGYYGPKGYGLGSVDVHEWRRVLEINTIAPLKLVEALLPLLNQGQDKKIMCLSSKVGSMTENTSGGGYLYRSSKAALNSVVKSLSHDLENQQYTVVALHPGWVQTEMGGPNALIDTHQSAQGLIKVINQSSTTQSGKFFDYLGKELPW